MDRCSRTCYEGVCASVVKNYFWLQQLIFMDLLCGKVKKWHCELLEETGMFSQTVFTFCRVLYGIVHVLSCFLTYCSPFVMIFFRYCKLWSSLLKLIQYNLKQVLYQDIKGQPFWWVYKHRQYFQFCVDVIHVQAINQSMKLHFCAKSERHCFSRISYN